MSQVLCIKAESQLLQLTLGGEQQFLGKGYLPYDSHTAPCRAVLCLTAPTIQHRLVYCGTVVRRTVNCDSLWSVQPFRSFAAVRRSATPVATIAVCFTGGATHSTHSQASQPV